MALSCRPGFYLAFMLLFVLPLPLLLPLLLIVLKPNLDNLASAFLSQPLYWLCS